MRRAKRVVHVQLGERRELLSKRRIVSFFLWMKPQIFQQHDAAAFRLEHLIDRGLRRRANAVGRKADGTAQQLGDLRRD